MVSSTLCHIHAERYDTLLVEECLEDTRQWERTSDVVPIQKCLLNKVLSSGSQAQEVGNLRRTKIGCEDGQEVWFGAQ